MNAMSTTTTRPDRPWRRQALGVALALAALATPTVALAAVSSADALASAPVDDTELGPRLERACLRIPNLQIRTTNVLTRIGGDSETRGSLLWLDQKIAAAREQGREQLVIVLENRREVRAATIPVLEDRQALLTDLADRCRELGVDL